MQSIMMPYVLVTLFTVFPIQQEQKTAQVHLLHTFSCP